MVLEPVLTFNSEAMPFMPSDSSFCGTIGEAIAFAFKSPFSRSHRPMFSDACPFGLDRNIKIVYKILRVRQTFVCSSSSASTSGRAQMRRRSSTDTAIGAALSAFKDIRPRAYQKVSNTMGEQDEAPTRIGAKSGSRP